MKGSHPLMMRRKKDSHFFWHRSSRLELIHRGPSQSLMILWRLRATRWERMTRSLTFRHQTPSWNSTRLRLIKLGGSRANWVTCLSNWMWRIIWMMTKVWLLLDPTIAQGRGSQGSWRRRTSQWSWSLTMFLTSDHQVKTTIVNLVTKYTLAQRHVAFSSQMLVVVI